METGMVFQQFNLFHTWRSCKTSRWLHQVRRWSKESNEIAQQLLERVGIPNRQGNTPGSFLAVNSSGWQSHALWPCSRKS
jgi:ABC-type polar amino acid transport system ATPase subunit